MQPSLLHLYLHPSLYSRGKLQNQVRKHISRPELSDRCWSKCLDCCYIDLMSPVK